VKPCPGVKLPVSLSRNTLMQSWTSLIVFSKTQLFLLAWGQITICPQCGEAVCSIQQSREAIPLSASLSLLLGAPVRPQGVTAVWRAWEVRACTAGHHEGCIFTNGSFCIYSGSCQRSYNGQKQGVFRLVFDKHFKYAAISPPQMDMLTHAVICIMPSWCCVLG